MRLIKLFEQYVKEEAEMAGAAAIGQKPKLTPEEVKLLSTFLSSIKFGYNKNSNYIIWKQDPANENNIADRSVSLTGNEDTMSLTGWKQNTPMIWSLYKNETKIPDVYFKIEKVSGNGPDCNKLIYSLYAGTYVGDSKYAGKGEHNISLAANIDKAIQTFNGIQTNVN